MGSKLTLTFSSNCLATHLPSPNKKQEDLCALPAVVQEGTLLNTSHPPAD